MTAELAYALSQIPLHARIGDTFLIRKSPRLERNYSKFLRLEPDYYDCIPYTVGVTNLDDFERALTKRTYHAMVQVRFNAARLPK